MRIGLMLMAFLMILSGYSNTFNSPPVLDDFHSFIEEPLVKGNSWTAESILSHAKTKFGWFRWLPMLSFSFDLWLGKGSIFYFHLTNLSIHLFNFFAVFMLMYVLLAMPPRRMESAEELPDPFSLAFWVAVLWALQPVQTNAVTYLVQRMTSFVTLFYVLGVAAYIAARASSGGKGKAYLLYSCSGIAMLLGFVSKENSGLFPLMVLITEFWFFDSALPTKVYHYCRRHWLLTCLGFAALCSMVVYQIPHLTAGYSIRHFTLGERLLTEARIVVWYASLLLWPHPDRLSMEHDVELSTSLLSPPTTLLSLLLILTTLSLSVVYRKKYPVITYGIIWYFMNLTVESTIVPLELVFEHRVYLPSIGIILSALAFLYRVVRPLCKAGEERNLSTVSWCVVALMASVLTLATFQRNEAWRNAVTYNRDNAVKAPNHPRARANLAVALGMSGRYEEAIREARTALSLGKRNFESYVVAANAIVLSYAGLNDYEMLIREGEKLVKELPAYADIQGVPILCRNLAIVQSGYGDLQGAFEMTRKCLEYNRMLGRPQQAIEKGCMGLLQTLVHEAARKAVDLDRDGVAEPGGLPSGTWIARHLLAWGYQERGRALLQAVAMDYPQEPETTALLADLAGKEEKNQIQERQWDFANKYAKAPYSLFNCSMAAAYYVQMHMPWPVFREMGETLVDYALTIQPNAPDAHILKAWYRFERGDLENAIKSARKALDLKPDYARGWIGLGFFLAKSERPQEAKEAFLRCLELYPACPKREDILHLVGELESRA